MSKIIQIINKKKFKKMFYARMYEKLLITITGRTAQCPQNEETKRQKYQHKHILKIRQKNLYSQQEKQNKSIKEQKFKTTLTQKNINTKK